MARNEEKANAMLNRFLAMKSEARSGGEKRPHLASLCDNLVKAEKWRGEIVREVGKKVSLIQNASWGEFRIRELNDEINKLLREKYHWEKRIQELGGPDYRLIPTKDLESVEVSDASGYKYFGAAKDLPGVRQLFEKAQAQAASKRTRKDLYDGIDPDYYGYRDEDDGLLLPAETAAESRVRAEGIEDWKQTAHKRQNTTEGWKEGLDVKGYVAHVPLPKPEDIAKVVLERKKKELLAKYASDDLVQQEQEARSLLNIR